MSAREKAAPKIILGDREYRPEYLEKVLRMNIAYSLRVLRLQRGFNQEQAAELCGMQQPAWSRLEDWNAEMPTLSTLHKIASFFDVALMVHFASWSEFFAQEPGQPICGFEDERHRESK